MDHKQKTLQELSQKASSVRSRRVIVGFDGFVDKIMTPVNKRHGQGDSFEAIHTITDFGERILKAAGESANIELFQRMEKLGGNGPIMANAIVAAGAEVQYIGALGEPVHSVFSTFANRTKAISICEPGITNALEFDDGKLMLGLTTSLEDITYDRIVAKMGEGALIDAFNRADLISLVNWTMIPNMTSIFEDLLTRLLPNLGPKESGRYFYFDLADPAKRSVSDLRGVLNTIARFRSFGSATLGLNFAEAKQVMEVLGHKPLDNNPDDLRSMASRIRNDLGLTCVVIHPRQGAACATKLDSWYVSGPFCEKPLISTGAGDHFNAGFATAQMLGLSPEACLTVAVSFSGQYVRTAKSPSLSDTAAFINNWRD
ncbi:MAG: PfkB family carbohydrate kinase [Verrucomicrobia bacterium]|nr:PfkB family carbohydrate kinase [Verrucomicrobiota bacterium]